MADILNLITKERELLQDAEPWRGLRGRSHHKEYSRIERELIAKSEKALSANSFSSTVEPEGFVSNVGGRQFILRPCLSLAYGILCDVPKGITMPTDYEVIRVKGLRILERPMSRFASRDRLKVEAIEHIKLTGVNLAPELTMGDARGILMDGYVDLPADVKNNLLISIVSSPGELTRVGGLTSTFLPIDSSYADAQYQLLEDLRKSIPRDLTAQYQLKIPVREKGEFTITPFPWALYNTSDARWDESIDSKTLARVSDGKSLQETTIGFAALSAAPKNLEAIYLTQTDFPMIVDKQVFRHGVNTWFRR